MRIRVRLEWFEEWGLRDRVCFIIEIFLFFSIVW